MKPAFDASAICIFHREQIFDPRHEQDIIHT
jgi:hypothetical protein